MEQKVAPPVETPGARGLIPILALTLCAFAIGTAEFVIAGLLPDIARDLDVSIPAAGQLVTAYAIGVVIGAPLMAIATSRMPRKRVLLLMLGIFIAGNLASALAPSYAPLLIARVAAAFAHGSLFGVGAVVATELVQPNKRASAVALMFTGLTIANIAGVPLGTLLGQVYGWRSTFVAICAIGIVALAAVAALIPNVAGGAIDVRREFVVARRPEVLLSLVTTVLGWGCVFVLFTYIVPILEQVSGFSPRAATIILLLIGVGFTIGINIGGRLADRGVMRTLIGMLALLALLSVVFAAASHSPIAATAVIFLWGMAAFGTIPSLQTRVLDSARGAPNIASSLNVGAFNLGNAGGALIGGLTIDWGFGLAAVPLAAAVVALAGLAVALVGQHLDRRAA